MANDTYRINGPRVIYENIDGETILVHMEKGTYYSTDDVGAALLDLIEKHYSATQMREALAAHFDARPEEIARAVTDFMGRLLEEDLVSIEESPSQPETLPAAPGARRPFRPPVLQCYRDMQDMLSLDPIHDVEAAGWPVPKADEPSTAGEPSP